MECSYCRHTNADNGSIYAEPLIRHPMLGYESAGSYHRRQGKFTIVDDKSGDVAVECKLFF